MAIDEKLARHCLHPQLLGKQDLACPVQAQRSFARTPHPSCEGRSPLETFRDWLDEALVEMEEESGKTKAMLKGQAQALVGVIALLENPYNPDPSAVLMEATRRIES